MKEILYHGKSSLSQAPCYDMGLVYKRMMIQFLRCWSRIGDVTEQHTLWKLEYFQEFKG